MATKKIGRPKMAKSEKRVPVTIMVDPDLARVLKAVDKNALVDHALRTHPDVAKALRAAG